MFKVINLWQIAIAAMLVMRPAYSAESAMTVVRTASQANTSPKVIVQSDSGNDSVIGLCIDIHRAIEQIDPSIRFSGDQIVKPAARVETELMHGSLDFACGMSHTADRDEKFAFVGPPIFIAQYFLAVRADDDIRVANWEQVRRLRDDGVVLVSHGFGPVARLKKMEGLVIDSGATDGESNLKKLVARRGRFYFHREPGMLFEIANAGLERDVKVLPTVMDTQSFHLVVRKSLPAATISKIEYAVTALAVSGELARLLKKWNGARYRSSCCGESILSPLSSKSTR